MVRQNVFLAVLKLANPKAAPDTLTRWAGALAFAAANGCQPEGVPAFLRTTGIRERYTQPASAFGAIRRRVNRARRTVGEPVIRFRVHDLRHKFAVDYLRAGGNIYTLQQILGHASIKTTELDLDHLTPDEKHTAKYGAGTKVGTDTTV